jgi:fructan beta-fructosidase
MNTMKNFLFTTLLITLSINLFSQESIKEFRLEKQYLNIPVDMQQNGQKVYFILGRDTLTYSDIRIADGEPDYWVFKDVSVWKGEKFTLTFPKKVQGIREIYQSEKIAGQDSLYLEKNRPQIHFTTRRGWNNDPNGMVYYDGEYHLFYQHNPYETNWGNMHWGHAVSEDLVHWRELPIALFPDELGTMYTGSAVIDYHNTAGFNKGSTVAMVAIYTADLRKGGERIGQHQCIAYSLDKGRTFSKYEGNPVIPIQKRFGSGHERDPKVFWYEPGKHWVLVLHEAINFSIYNSTNLKDWEYKSSVVAGFWECPELFELAVDDNPDNKKWVMYGARGTYLIGDFDGKTFTPETDMLSYNIGGMTAAQTFNDEPNGRRIQIGWGHARFPGMPFSQTFTFPQEYSLKTTPKGLRLFIRPVKEIEKLYAKSYSFTNEYIGENINEKLSDIKSPLLHIKTKLEIENGREFGMNINGYKIGYNVATNRLNNTFLPLQNKQLDLDIIVDKTLIEVYANGGLVYWFANNNGKRNDFNISMFTAPNDELNPNPKTLIKSLEIHELKSIWNL